MLGGGGETHAQMWLLFRDCDAEIQERQNVEAETNGECLSSGVAKGTVYPRICLNQRSRRRISIEACLCTKCARIERFQSIGVSFERKADSPIGWKR